MQVQLPGPSASHVGLVFLCCATSRPRQSPPIITCDCTCHSTGNKRPCKPRSSRSFNISTSRLQEPIPVRSNNRNRIVGKMKNGGLKLKISEEEAANSRARRVRQLTSRDTRPASSMGKFKTVVIVKNT